MHFSKIEFAADAHLAVSSRSLELLKWIAVVCMLQEHYFRFVVGELPDWSYALGRLTLPLFAFALSVGLTQLTTDRKWRVFARLAIWGVIAQAATWAVGGYGYGNVLFIFALATLVVLSLERGLVIGIAAIGAAITLSLFCEFGPLGVGAVLLMCLAQYRRSWEGPCLLIAFLLIVAANRGDWTPIAALPIVVALSILEVGPPRIRHAFYWIYALQFPAFAAVRALL